MIPTYYFSTAGRNTKLCKKITIKTLEVHNNLVCPPTATLLRSWMITGRDTQLRCIWHAKTDCFWKHMECEAVLSAKWRFFK